MQRYLCDTYPGASLPCLPEAPSSSRGKDAWLIEQEKISKQELGRWLTRIACHPILGKDDKLRDFIENDRLVIASFNEYSLHRHQNHPHINAEKLLHPLTMVG